MKRNHQNNCNCPHKIDITVPLHFTFFKYIERTFTDYLIAKRNMFRKNLPSEALNSRSMLLTIS